MVAAAAVAAVAAVATVMVVVAAVVAEMVAVVLMSMTHHPVLRHPLSLSTSPPTTRLLRRMMMHMTTATATTVPAAAAGLTCTLPANLDVAVHVALSHIACAHGDGRIESLAPLCGVHRDTTPATRVVWLATLRSTIAYRLAAGEWGFTPPAWRALVAAAEPIITTLTTRKDHP